jgi:hypothetical protein
MLSARSTQRSTTRGWDEAATARRCAATASPSPGSALTTSTPAAQTWTSCSSATGTGDRRPRCGPPCGMAPNNHDRIGRMGSLSDRRHRPVLQARLGCRCDPSRHPGRLPQLPPLSRPRHHRRHRHPGSSTSSPTTSYRPAPDSSPSASRPSTRCCPSPSPSPSTATAASTAPRSTADSPPTVRAIRRAVPADTSVPWQSVRALIPWCSFTSGPAVHPFRSRTR